MQASYWLLLLLLLQVNEMPGSYFYHDHSSLNRADGLQVRPVVQHMAGRVLACFSCQWQPKRAFLCSVVVFALLLCMTCLIHNAGIWCGACDASVLPATFSCCLCRTCTQHMPAACPCICYS
jgi:hypothetical protein